MKLHEYKDAFEGAIVAAAQHFDIPEIYIEKDYWVTYALKQIFSDKTAKDLAVFKGGTSLSKCFKIIERFSEDIDLVVFQKTGDSGAALKGKLKKVTNAVGDALTYIPNHPFDVKLGKIRKLYYKYPKANAQGDFGQVSETIAVEVSNLGNTHPYESMTIHTMIAEFIGTTNNVDLIQNYGLEPFDVNVLSIERTFCEKIISLVRFSYAEEPLKKLAGKVRHTYDLHQMLRHDRISEFMHSTDFEAMLVQVGKDDDKAIPNDKDWLLVHPSEAMLFSKTKEVWETIGKTYNSTFAELLTGKLPEEALVVKSLLRISERLKNIQWTM